MFHTGFPGGSDGKGSACSAGDLDLILSWDDPLEDGTATHSRIFAWRIPWTEEPGELQFMGLQRVESDTTERLPKVLYRLAPAYLIVLISHNLSPHDTTITQPSFCSLAPGSRSLHLLSLRSIHLGHSASLPLAAFAPHHSGLPLSITSESLWPLT